MKTFTGLLKHTHTKVINFVSFFLGSDTSLNPSLNFVIYTPTRDQTPLRIYDLKGKITLFLISVYINVIHVNFLEIYKRHSFKKVLCCFFSVFFPSFEFFWKKYLHHINILDQIRLYGMIYCNLIAIDSNNFKKVKVYYNKIFNKHSHLFL